MSSLTDLIVIGAVGVGAYYLYNNWTPAKAAVDTTIGTIGSTLDLAGNPNLDAAKENLKEANTKVVDEINESLNVNLPKTPEPVIDTIVDLKGGSVLPNMGVPAVVNGIKSFFDKITASSASSAPDASKTKIEIEDTSVPDISAKTLTKLKGAEITDSGIPVQANILPGQGLAKIAGDLGGLVDDVISGRWEWTGLPKLW